ncbi:MAG TPA: patatin-like phospholipase family protein [Burkholderiales bacterium]|nr:patatin-like phospholipase family protein [Burkholderiales bacterium]
MSALSRFLSLFCVLFVFGCASALREQPRETLPPQPKAEAKSAAPKVALVLGGGAARGFAHVGVIKVLEANGIRPDIVVGVSAGSLVGALYAGGYGAADLERVALTLDERVLGDWTLPHRGIFKGEALQDFVNRAVQYRPLEKLNRVFAVVATDLQSGEQVVFRRGNTGMAVRASSSVPGVFQPVRINGREYVDGGLTGPVPVRVARRLGADVVIAVDVSARPKHGGTADTLEVLLQTFAIMGQAIAANELPEADIVIRPDTSQLTAIGFENRGLAIREGERAARAALPQIQARLTGKAGGGG